jgi:hypothetical protein
VWNFQKTGSLLIPGLKSMQRLLLVRLPDPTCLVVSVSRLWWLITSAGYFTQGKKMTEEELKAVQGRMWEE